MSRIKVCLAYSWALLAAPLVLVTFMGMGPLAAKLVAVTGLHVHPLYTGGEVARTIDRGTYRTLIHRPVFDGLVGPRKHGFVQIQWQPKDANLPELIEEQIDLNADHAGEFRIRLDTKTNTASVDASDRSVLSVGEVLTVGNARLARINLERR